MYEHYYVLAQYVLSSVSQVKYWDPALTVHDNTGNWAVSPRLACSDYVIFYNFISWFPSFDFISIFVLLFANFLFCLSMENVMALEEGWWMFRSQNLNQK